MNVCVCSQVLAVGGQCHEPQTSATHSAHVLGVVLLGIASAVGRLVSGFTTDAIGDRLLARYFVGLPSALTLTCLYGE